MAEKIVFASGKGGVGKSTCVVGIALALKDLGKKVLLVDLDVSLSSLDVILGVGESVVNNWGDIILERCNKEKAVIEKDGISLLCAPKKSEDEFSLKNIRKTVGLYEEDFDYILIDSPAGVGKYFEIACRCADRGIVVSNAEDVCVRSAGVAANNMREFGMEDIRLIINKMITKLSVGKKNLNIDSVIDKVCVRLIGVVPYDENIALASMSERNFKLKKKPQKSFSRIARRIDGEDIKLKILR